MVAFTEVAFDALCTFICGSGCRDTGIINLPALYLEEITVGGKNETSLRIKHGVF